MKEKIPGGGFAGCRLKVRYSAEKYQSSSRRKMKLFTHAISLGP
jgi:hypothetical protein